ncbi:chemotaxis protein [Bombiscardovia nodaiensis]|uniref:Chemotaxis protein n=1 Tax=Bombiscardovia nodaiensis TaxID=2932181 RepID=A0ABM8BAC1_9BIFI|nr:chemotaxis protein [Bombiscardovia nodaiensis]
MPSSSASYKVAEPASGKGHHDWFGSHSRQIKPKKRHILRYVLLTILLLLIIAAAVCGYVGYKFYQDAMAVKTHEEQALSYIKTFQDEQKLMQDPGALTRSVPQIQSETAAAKKIAHGDMWERAAKLPKYGDDIKTVQGMVDVVDDMAKSTFPPLTQTIEKLTTAKFSQGDGQINLQPIEDASAGFLAANQNIQKELKALKALPKPQISQVQSVYDTSVKQFSDVSAKVEQLNNTIQILPQFLGSKAPRNYIIVAQTPSEERSGGGLIGSLGSMNATNGKITVGDFHPNTEFIELGKGGVTGAENIFTGPLKFSFDIRDLSAYPDFSQEAQIVNQRWQWSQYAGPVDGVIMIDPVFIQEVIKISGNIKTQGGLELTGDNTAEFFLNGIYKTVPVYLQDEVFAGVAAQAMNNVFSNMDIHKLLSLTNMMAPMAEGRHLYAYTFHEDEAKSFQEAGLAKDAPNSAENPEVGVYLNENNPSKLGWYLHRKSTITKTSHNSDGSQSYHMVFSMANTIPQADLYSGNSYILGGINNIGAVGTPVERMLFYGPKEGSLSNFKINGNSTELRQATMNGKSLWTGVATIAPGKSVTYEFDVTTSPKAQTDLKLDQTPMGWADPGVTYNKQ